MITSPAIIAIILAVFVALAFGGGFAVSSWRDGAEIQRLNSSNAVLSAANDKCATDIQNVRAAMTALTDATTTLEKQAAKEMQKAEPKVAERTRVITKIKAMPKVAVDMQCEAIKNEQIEYVQARK